MAVGYGSCSAMEPVSSTRVTVAIKDQARNSAEQICQQYYSLIKPNAGVSDADVARWLELAPRYGLRVVGPPIPEAEA